MTDKRTLRRRFADARKVLTPEFRRTADRAIRARVMALPEARDCRALALYATDGVEPDLTPLMREAAGKLLLFPRYRADRGEYEFAVVSGPADLTPGKFGLLEPAADCPSADPETVRRETLHLVPGLAFDGRGIRLGRGGGFYDRLLSGVTGPVCGVFYRCQFSAEDLPAEAHDRALGIAVTEDFTIRWIVSDNNKQPERKS